MKIWVIIFLLGLCLFLGFLHPQTDNPSPVMRQIVETVRLNHLTPREINDDLSKDLFQYYLDQIDPDKLFFTQKEINKLKSYELMLDDEWKNASLAFFDQSAELLKTCITDAEKSCHLALSEEMNLQQTETLETQSAKLEFAKDEDELRERWRQVVKKHVLEVLLALEAKYPNESFEINQKNAIARTAKLYSKEFENLKNREKNTLLESYMNAFLKVHDIQSEYLSREQKARWEAEFARAFFGIGVELKIADGYPKIDELVAGGPAWKSKQLERGDVITHITAADNLAVEVGGLELNEVINLLKGEKGTAVQLTVKTTSNEIREISLIRDKIDMDMTMAFLLQYPLNEKNIAYIRLPRFYDGEEGCAAHILQAITRLNEAKAEGMILDLRDNQGGSAREAIKIMGYFLENGAVMQAEYQNGNHRVFEDTDGVAQFEGKLVVLVNSSSASASELFSGTMQDYGRAIVVGSHATYGKGTIQRFFDLNENLRDDEFSYGEVKLTIGKFFTANGRTIQYKGIHPDIVLPAENQFIPSGERGFPYAFIVEDLPVTPVAQSVCTYSDIEKIKQLSMDRVSQDGRFQIISQRAEVVRDNNTNSVISLNYEKYKAAKDKERVSAESVKNSFIETDGFAAIPQIANIQDTASVIRHETWKEKIQKDPYILECYRIMNDLFYI